MGQPTEVNQSDSHGAVAGARPTRAAVAGVLAFALFACGSDSASQEPGQVAACDL